MKVGRTIFSSRPSTTARSCRDNLPKTVAPRRQGTWPFEHLVL